MWKLTSDQNNKRIYTNTVTNSTCSQTMCYTDRESNKWFEFDSLTAIPYTRNFAATKISSLYALGLSRDDVRNFFTKHKATLKSKDEGEKYERAYSELLNFESMFENASNPLKQQSALVPVYFTLNDELIDSFSEDLQVRKLSLLEADIEMHSFFLNKLLLSTERYMNFLDQISQIALPQLNGE